MPSARDAIASSDICAKTVTLHDSLEAWVLEPGKSTLGSLGLDPCLPLRRAILVETPPGTPPPALNLLVSPGRATEILITLLFPQQLVGLLGARIWTSFSLEPADNVVEPSTDEMSSTVCKGKPCTAPFIRSGSRMISTNSWDSFSPCNVTAVIPDAELSLSGGA